MAGRFGRWLGWGLVVLGGAMGGAGSVRGQGVGDREMLLRFRDSLAALDSMAAGRVAGVERERAERSGEPVPRLRSGLAQVRSGETGRMHAFGRAERAFGRAGRMRPAWPWPPYGRALALAARSEALSASRTEIGQRAGAGPLHDAVEALAEALGHDPGFEPALHALGEWPFRLRDSSLRIRALEAVRQALAAGRGADGGGGGSGAPARADRSAALWLALGRLERADGRGEAAVLAFARYRDLGGQAALAHLELARTRLMLGLAGGEADYYAGAALDHPAAVAEYRADLRYLADDSALAEFDGARGAERAAVLRRFWTERDRRELRADGERLREHYRRLFHARRRFAPALTRRVYWPDCAFRSEILELDDRGVIYVRHGEPTRRVAPILSGMPPNETWRYERPDGDLLFHFSAGTDPHDYRLAPSILAVGSACAGLRGGGASADLLLSREAIDPMYGKLATWGPGAASARLLRRERALVEGSIATGTRTDTHPLRFARPLPVAVSAAAIGREGDAMLVHVVYGIPGGVTAPRVYAGGWIHPIRVRFAAFDSSGRVVAHADRTERLTTPELVDSSAHLVGRVSVPVPPGAWRWRVAVQYGDSAGSVLPAQPITVARPDGGGPGLSDLVLGWRPLGLVWARGPRDSVFFSPFRSYSADAELELAYEVYGVRAGAELTTRIVLQREGGGILRRRPSPVVLEFGSRAPGPVAPGRRTIQLATLRPGRYRLELTVTDAEGRSVHRRSGFEVRTRPGDR